MRCEALFRGIVRSRVPASMRGGVHAERSRVRLITRSDTSLVFALICGAIVVFRRPLHFFLDLARDLEVRYQVDLLPALIIMSGVFIFHQYRKRQ